MRDKKQNTVGNENEKDGRTADELNDGNNVEINENESDKTRDE